ncbi:hypothetical protein DVH05_005503 [Phytophthora capsici]|nr:hypothetical protein DVH05_005503 [Phytophthora capsici]
MGNNSSLCEAAKTGDLSRVKKLVRRGADVNERDKNNGPTALTVAAMEGNLQVVRYLVGKGADQKANNVFAASPLIEAAYEGHSRVDVLNAVDKDGNTALIRATKQGHLDVVKFLVEEKADSAIRNGQNNTALIEAACCGRIKVLCYLVEKKRPGIEEMNVALVQAAYSGHANVVRYLVEQEADTSGINAAGWTALMISACAGQPALARYLLERTVKDDKAAMELTVNKENREMISFFNGIGANIDVQAVSKALVVNAKAGVAMVELFTRLNITKEPEEEDNDCTMDEKKDSTRTESTIGGGDTPEMLAAIGQDLAKTVMHHDAPFSVGNLQ